MKIHSKSPVINTVLAIVMTASNFAFADEFLDIDQVHGIQNEVFSSVQQSSVRFQIANGSSCTGTWVSADGLMLTALHCLQSCFSYPDNDGLRPIETTSVQYAQPDLGFPRSVNIRRIIGPRAFDRICKVESGQYEDEVSSNLGAQLVFTPAKGWIDPWDVKFLRKKDMPFLQKLRNEKLSGIGDESDIALIRIFQIDPNKSLVLPEYFNWPSMCAKIKFERINDDEPVFSISYPALSRSNKDSLYKPQFTLGTILGSDKQSSAVITFLRTNFPGSSFIVSTLDAEGGSSGSGVFDINGYIRGLTFLGLGPATHYVSGRTVSIPLNNFFEEMPSNIKVRLCQ